MAQSTLEVVLGMLGDVNSRLAESAEGQRIFAELEAGNLDLLGDAVDGLLHRAFESVVIDPDLECYKGSFKSFGCDAHSVHLHPLRPMVDDAELTRNSVVLRQKLLL